MRNLLILMLACYALAGCVVVPARPVAYYPTPVYVGGGYHYWH